MPGTGLFIVWDTSGQGPNSTKKARDSEKPRARSLNHSPI